MSNSGGGSYRTSPELTMKAFDQLPAVTVAEASTLSVHAASVAEANDDAPHMPAPTASAATSAQRVTTRPRTAASLAPR